jgi:hypothetical protein
MAALLNGSHALQLLRLAVAFISAAVAAAGMVVVVIAAAAATAVIVH